MSKRFKTHKKNNFIKKILLFIAVVLLTTVVSFNVVYEKVTKNLTDIEVINILLNKDNSFDKIFSGSGINFIVNYTMGLDLNKNNLKKEKIDIIPVMKQEEVVLPLIYIYNTHQTEEYRGINTNDYNVTPTVLHASLILKNKLENLGIPTIVEENSIKDVLNINGWSYRNSYKVSKMFAEEVLKNNPSVKYIIDLHRDSVNENISTITIDDKNYAKIMIVLGKGHDGFERNLEFANRINNGLKKFNEGLSRGIDIKEKSGIFNQDLSPNAVLIEVGGPYNDINSVSNTLDVLANVMKDVILEDESKEET